MSAMCRGLTRESIWHLGECEGLQPRPGTGGNGGGGGCGGGGGVTSYHQVSTSFQTLFKPCLPAWPYCAFSCIVGRGAFGSLGERMQL